LRDPESHAAVEGRLTEARLPRDCTLIALGEGCVPQAIAAHGIRSEVLLTAIPPAGAGCAARPRNASCYDKPIVELLAPGTIVADRYRLIRKRGSGGVGSVWLAHDLSLDSFCGIKLIDVRQANAAELSVRCEREARSAAQLRCTHVIDVFEHGIWNGIPFIAMEFLDGEDLGERLKRTARLNPARTYHIVAQVARALVRAHGIGIVHRDLKPDNVFLVPGDEHEIAKLLDFGIARHSVYSEEIKTTQAGSLIGTPCYLSPEQARGETVDWRSDLWALGIIVFECLTGRLPFESDALGELVLMILCKPIPAMRHYNPALPQAIDGWWQRACARDPAERFQSAKQLADALATALAVHPRLEIPDIVPLALRSQGAASLAPVSLPAAAAPDERLPVPRLRPLPRRWLLPATVAAVLAIVAISTISRARDLGVGKGPPALLRRSPAAALPLPTIEPDRGSVRAEARRAVPAPRRGPVRPIPAVRRRHAPENPPRMRPAQSMRKEPSQACERDVPEAETPKAAIPDYGI
jgi:serine/threonine protein kinase